MICIYENASAGGRHLLAGTGVGRGWTGGGRGVDGGWTGVGAGG